jgi:hypothetical protein
MVSCAGKEEAQAHKHDCSDDKPPDAYRRPVIWKHNPVADDRARDTKDNEPNDPGRSSGHGSSGPLNQKPHKENAAKTSQRPLWTSGHARFPEFTLNLWTYCEKATPRKNRQFSGGFSWNAPLYGALRSGRGPPCDNPRHGPEDHGPNIQTDARPATERNCIGDR